MRNLVAIASAPYAALAQGEEATRPQFGNRTPPISSTAASLTRECSSRELGAACFRRRARDAAPRPINKARPAGTAALEVTRGYPREDRRPPSQPSEDSQYGWRSGGR